jgi:hypothetical protein
MIETEVGRDRRAGFGGIACHPRPGVGWHMNAERAAARAPVGA